MMAGVLSNGTLCVARDLRSRLTVGYGEGYRILIQASAKPLGLFNREESWVL